ncbi:MAG: D-glycero-beta-D-manno-heptose-7-phosphate kinase [Candidatus Aminicenantes bacterium]|nr:D-glycero-beta-D-manno-heptose-7-phosphate kinase [Candidatus Aminicenantes bacterium]
MIPIPFNRQRLFKLIERFNRPQLVVLGDLMLDKYIWGEVSRISPEAPVPVVEVKRDTSCLGGAGNVAHNIEALGGKSILVGIVGDDEPGQWIKAHVRDNRGIFVEPSRPTTVKTRIIAHHQQVVRVDIEKRTPLPDSLENAIFSFLQKLSFDGLVISDYNKGLIKESLIKNILDLAHKKGIPVFVDPKVENFHLFSPITLITPNHHEAERIVRQECRTNAQIEEAGQKIFSLIDTRYIILKRGEQGMTVFERGKRPIHIPTVAREVFDVTGAGDTVIATASLALLAGATIEEAALLANAAAGIVVGKIGTATVSPEELKASLYV